VAIDTIMIKASALTDAVSPSAGGIVTHITFDDDRAGRDLARELARSAGLQMRRYGGTGFAAVPALRGASAAQIRVFLDGMPLNSAQTGEVDLSRLPTDRLAGAEVHRGVVPTGWGGMGGAGAVNLLTREETQGTDLALFTGSFGDVGGRVSWGASGHEGQSSLLVMAHARRADNDYSFRHHNQTFHTAGDDSTRKRVNAAFEEWGLWATGKHETGRLAARVAGGFFRKDGGRPGPLNYPTVHAAVRHQRGNGQARLTWAEHLNLELAAATERQDLYDPRNEIQDGFGGTISSQSEDVTGRLSWTGPLLDTLDLVVGGEQRRQGFRQWYGTDADPDRSRRTTSAFAGLTAHLLGRRLQLMPAWRWQRNVDDFPPLPALPWLPEDVGVRHERDDVSPSLGALWAIQPDRWYLQATAARSVRVPTWVELFGHRGGIDGNRDLAAEEITAADVGLTLQSDTGASYVRLAIFHAETDQAIIFVQNSPGTSKALNIGRTRSRGLELESSWTSPLDLKWSGNLTWQQARDRSDDPVYRGNHLPYLSDVTAWLRVSRPVGPWDPWVECFWESEKYRDRASTELIKAPDRGLVHVGLARTWYPGGPGVAGRLTVTGEIRNLFNNTTYDVEEFPLPGRSWQLSVRLGG
jgi:iron complex outermembrane receptor protein